MMKKILSIIFLFMIIAPVASAYQFTRDPSGTGQYESVEYTVTIEAGDIDWVTNGTGWVLALFTEDSNGLVGNELWYADAIMSSSQNMSYGVYTVSFNFVENKKILGASILVEDGGTYDGSGYTWAVDLEWTTLVSGWLYEGFIFETTTSNASFFPNTSALVSDFSASTAGTLSSLLPIIGVLAGLMLALLLVPKMVSWFKNSVQHYKDYMDRVG